GFERIHLPAARAPELALAASAGYAFTEAQAAESGAHHRAAGSLAFGAALRDWLGVGLRFDGRHDVHPDDGMGSDSGTVGDPRLLVRAGGAASDGVLLGGEASLWIPGENAPSLSFAASTLDLRATAALLPPASAWAFAASAGYRLDNSARAAPALEDLRPGDRFGLALSSFDAVLAGLGVAHRAGALELLAEASWDVLVGSGAPSALDSPLRLLLGARVQLGAALQLAFAAIASPSGRSSSIAAQDLVPAEPRFALQAGLRFGFGASTARDADEDATGLAPPPSAVAHPARAASSGPVTGRVLDADGAPVAGARVSLRSEGSAADGGANEQGLEAETDADGRYAFEQVPFGTVSLSAEREGYAGASWSLELGSDSGELPDQVLPRAALGELRGLALSFRGKPVPARIAVRPLEPPDAAVNELAAGTDGRFRIELPPGRYEVEVGAPGFVSQTRKVEITADGVVILNLDLRAAR
ncbi:MAG TPA: carboxypeptidase-like regulatory domain-containing protein, partial [Polyangiales bacterium]|nr:carboxypeptidase-like regulatory domain-containing protein [Polyangiales bacterium]